MLSGIDSFKGSELQCVKYLHFENRADPRASQLSMLLTKSASGLPGWAVLQTFFKFLAAVHFKTKQLTFLTKP